ncbi:MAG: bacteriohemerythrin [Gammaproteobacteria bacterium]
MSFMNWTDQLSVRIPSVDRQHKVLIGYINKLADVVQKEVSPQLVDLVLKGLITYTKVHFMYEEMLFKTYKYAEMDDHKRAHVKFISRVNQFNERFKAGDSNVGLDLLNFLKDWLSIHILKEDVAYSEYMLAKGVK